MAANLGVDTEVDNARTTTSAIVFFREALSALDKGLRSTRNSFGSVCKLATGTTTGTIPLIGTLGKLANSVVPKKIPFSKITTGNFLASQFPQVFANRIGTGAIAKERINNLPATKIQFGRLKASQLPSGWSNTARPTQGGNGGQGVVAPAGGILAGSTTAPFVSIKTPNGPAEPRFRIDGRIDGNTLRLQVRGEYRGTRGAFLNPDGE